MVFQDLIFKNYKYLNKVVAVKHETLVFKKRRSWQQFTFFSEVNYASNTCNCQQKLRWKFKLFKLDTVLLI